MLTMVHMGSVKNCIYLYNKTRHKFLYIYVEYSRQNSWTDYAEIFCRHLGVAGGCYRLKQIQTYFLNFFFIYFLYVFQNKCQNFIFKYFLNI